MTGNAARSGPPIVRPLIVGMLEAVGQLSARELFVAGWSREQRLSGHTVVVITGEGAVKARWFAEWSDRPDVGPGTSYCGVLQLDGPVLAASVAAVHFSAVMVVGLYEHRQLLDDLQSIQRLRGRARVGEPNQSIAAAASRYDGSDSVATTSLPIRLGIDDCVALDDHSIMLSGWLFDPEGLVRTVDLVSGDVRHGINGNWVRRRRKDVLASLGADGRFALYAGCDDHCGFTSIVEINRVNDVHLTLNAGGEPLHVPLMPRFGNGRLLLSGMLCGLDPDLPSSLDIVDGMVAPILARLQPARPNLPGCSRLGFDVDAPMTIVVGCSGDTDDVVTLLAMLAANSTARTTPILIAAPANEIAASQGDILRRAEFFGLDVALAKGESIADHVDALAAGAMASAARTLCLLPGDMVPDTGDWLQRLWAALPDEGSIVLPNQFDQLAFGDQASQRERSKLTGGGDCCLVPRLAWLGAYEKLGSYLARPSKSQALLQTLSQTLPLVQCGDVDVLHGSANAPALSLLTRADRAADALRRAVAS